MSGADWWARKLGGTPAPAATGYPPPSYAPASYRPPQYAPPVPQAPQPDENGQIHALDAVAHYRGTSLAQAEGAQCPECRRPGLYSRSHGATKVNVNSGRAATPAPQCVYCGYNGLFTQSSSSGGVGDASIRVEGAPRASRQGHSSFQNFFAPRSA